MQYLIAFTFLLAPTFAWRFALGPMPANFLMLWIFFVWIIFAIWLLVKKQLREFIASSIKIDRKLLVPIILLIIAATVSLFVGGISQEKLGQYLVLFVQPIGMFFIARYLYHKFPDSQKWLVYSFYAFLLVSGVYAIYQYYTLVGLPPKYWGNSIEPKRSITFFSQPDAFALFVGPVLAFLIPDVFTRLSKLKENVLNIFFPLAWLAGLAGLIYSLSRGGWIGFVAACAAFVIISANKKYIIGAVCVMLVAAGFIYYIPNFRYRIILPFHGQRSALARLTVWDAGLKMIKESPILGQGINGYSENFPKYTSDPALEHHNYPHMILLNFWVETGILGVLSFIGISLFAVFYGIKNRKNLIAFGILLFFAALLAHGLVDNPYFKNDLALVFWLVLGLIAL